jgi:hypothetical protein
MHLAVAGLTLSCGSKEPEQATQGDPGYVFDAVAAIREGGLISARQPGSGAWATSSL